MSPRTYRGLRVDNGKWVEGWYMEHPFKDEPTTFVPCIVHDERPYQVHPESVGQQIGKQDKNEVEIYEGDICRWVDTDGRVYEKEVNWDNEQLCWNFGIIRYCRLNESGYYQTKMEVIGNIHQNPKLLEDK